MRKKNFLLALLLPAMIYSDLTGPELVDEILLDHKEWIYERYGFTPLYKGLGAPCGHVTMIQVCFERECELCIPEAREICIVCMEDLLTRINANTPIRPYLQKYPFAFENLRYSLIFDKSKSKKNTLTHYMYSVSSCSGKIYYNMNIAGEIDINNIISEDFNKARLMVIESNSQGL